MLQSSFDQQQKASRLSQIVLVALLGLSLVINVGLLSMREDPTVILLPGDVSGNYKISQSIFDDRYLADASTSIAYAYLSTTPSSVDYRRENILRWVHPSSFQEIAVDLEKEGERIKSQRLTSALSISSTKVKSSAAVATAVIEGRLSRFIAGREFSQQQIAMTIKWERDERGTALVSDLKWKVIER